MELSKYWKTIQQLFLAAGQSSFHVALSTVDSSGLPWVTPIGSMILRENLTGFYFEEFPQKLSKNLETNHQVCVLALNSDPNYWINSLGNGFFETPPGVRLTGTASELRPATEEEIAQWQERVAMAAGTKGHEILWKDMKTIREITFKGFAPVYCGEMTSNLWSNPE